MDTEFRILAIDNYDSFVHILADEFRRRRCLVEVYRNHWPIEQALDYIETSRPTLLLMSPGPGRPDDANLCLDLLRRAPRRLPVFGVCLGYQCIVHYFGGTVGRVGEVVHGKPALIRHRGEGIFRGLDSPMQVGRYHSLVGVGIDGELVVTADCDGIPMAVEHRERPIWGVQFHPESVLSPLGGRLIDNVLTLMGTYHAD
jgi:anthranilate synthase/aminodeoxychorismate synthase-like glutamine amidotransferase